MPIICSGVRLPMAAVSFRVTLPQFCSENEHAAVLSFPNALLKRTGVRTATFPFKELGKLELSSI